MGDRVNDPHRPLPVVAPAPVYCLHCEHRREYECKLDDVYSPPNPINGQIGFVNHTTCTSRNATRQCQDFAEKPLSWWERMFGRRYP